MGTESEFTSEPDLFRVHDCSGQIQNIPGPLPRVKLRSVYVHLSVFGWVNVFAREMEKEKLCFFRGGAGGGGGGEGGRGRRSLVRVLKQASRCENKH